MRDGNGPTCGYDSCPCRGVNFISRYMLETDYCVNGKRTRIKDGQPLPRPIFLYALDKYAAFLEWHTKNRTAGKILDREPSPFGYTLAEEVAA